MRTSSAVRRGRWTCVSTGLSVLEGWWQVGHDISTGLTPRLKLLVYVPTTTTRRYCAALLHFGPLHLGFPLQSILVVRLVLCILEAVAPLSVRPAGRTQPTSPPH